MRVSDIVQAGNFARLIELFPPGLPIPESMRESQKFDLSLRFERLVQNIQELGALADAFSLPELKDPARIHLNSVAVACELEKRTNSEVIPTITLRDANRQGIMGSVSFGLFAGLENIQIVRGDPYEDGMRSVPVNVYDLRRVSALVMEVRKLESHILNRERLCILAPLNLTKLEDPKYMATARDRQSSGIDIFVTESMFEEPEKYLGRIEKIRDLGIKSPIIHNIFAFRNYEDALACVQKFGWNVSEQELHRLKIEGEKYGIDMARHRYYALFDRREMVQGVCISTRGNANLARLITE